MAKMNDPKRKLQIDMKSISQSIQKLSADHDNLKFEIKSLLKRIRPNCEAAPWVIDELKRMLNEY
jgi:phage host-nuclease inhibitor protein Gam